MSRPLTPQSSLELLKREAKRWLKALRANDAAARARFQKSHPKPPAEPTLRDVQLALARELELASWSELKRAVEAAHGGRSPLESLLDAAGRGDVPTLRALLDRHPELLNQPGAIGESGLRTALHFGVHHGDVVQLLLDRGADPNIRDEGDNAYPLHFVAETGELPIVKQLIEAGADPVGDGTTHDLNVLGWAVCFDYAYHQDVADFLLAHGARHDIFTATAMGDVEALRAVLRRFPAEANKPMDRTNLRRRPLHLAVVKQQPSSLAALLAFDADPNETDASGLTPLDQAALDGQDEMVEELLRHGAHLSLPAAVVLGRVDEVERLLHSEPNAVKPGGVWGSTLVRAVVRAPARVVEALIAHGASPDAVAEAETAIDQASGYTALHAAAFAGNLEAVRTLLAHGANTSARDGKYCGTPAAWADYAGRTAARDLILATRIDPFDALRFDRVDRLPDIVQQSPWTLEKTFGQYTACASNGAPWIPPAWHTPLWWAVMSGKLDAARVLLGLGAQQILSPDRKTMIDAAKEAGLGDMVRLLEEHSRG